MKYAVFLIDGMADHPIPELGGKTPLEAAATPNIDRLAAGAAFGTFTTLPEGFPTSSDVANMSVLGWDLKKSYTGRGAIESYGMGIALDGDTIAFRMNLIHVNNGILDDYSAGHISDAEARELVSALEKELGGPGIVFQKGVSYRHLLYLKGGQYSPEVLYEKPDSSQGMEWEKLLPKPMNEGAKRTADVLTGLIRRSAAVLENHPVNQKRAASGRKTANLIWPWSGGRKPDIASFFEMYGKKGSIISAVDVILGLGKLGGMETLRPEGATGYIDTNYENKALAGLDMLERNDFVYVHVEAVDECGHNGDLPNKIKAIEDTDKRLIGVFLEGYKKKFGEPLRVMVLPDHPVPVKMRKHTREAVPFMISGDGVKADPSIRRYSETTCPKGKYAGLSGRQLMDLFFGKSV